MERSCENCRNSCKVGHKMSYCIINERKCWEPDYPTLERENAELKQQLEKLQNEKSAYELLYHITERHSADDTIKNQKQIADLTQALERACGFIANKKDANSCPVNCKAYEPWDCGDETCMKMLIRHFKEAMQ
jgi:hypothetical protein